MIYDKEDRVRKRKIWIDERGMVKGRESREVGGCGIFVVLGEERELGCEGEEEIVFCCLV